MSNSSISELIEPRITSFASSERAVGRYRTVDRLRPNTFAARRSDTGCASRRNAAAARC